MHVELSTGQPGRPDMNREEAVATCDAIRTGLIQIDEKVAEVREQILVLHDRKGWVALGYSTWKACVTDEFDASYRHVNRQLQAAMIEQEIAKAELDGKGPMVPSHDESLMKSKGIPESHLRPLTSVPKNEVAEVWQEIKATAPEGKVTEKHSKAVVDRKSGKPKPEPKSAVPRSQYKTEINGQAAADPPDIAAQRASGKIGAGVVVEITEPEPDDEPEPQPEPTPEADTGETEEEWIAALPLSTSLTGMSLAIFQSDARRYFRMKTARDAVRHHNGIAGKGLRKDGEYFRRVTGFLKLADPRDWIRCPTVDNGGCNGTGQIELIGACPKCFGRGYTIDNRRQRGASA